MDDNPALKQFQSAYEGKPPWDLDRPQTPFVEIADRLSGSVLDAGCGTGENALFFAERGHPVVGIDFVEPALEQARRKADLRGLPAEFLRWDAMELGGLGRTFANVIDCGLFHVFSDPDRRRYVDGLGRVIEPGGRLLLMCFSDAEPPGKGPRRISQNELRSTFSGTWGIESIAPTRFEVGPGADPADFSPGGPRAWFAVIHRKA